jgi:hypothetical protein
MGQTAIRSRPLGTVLGACARGIALVSFSAVMAPAAGQRTFTLPGNWPLGSAQPAPPSRTDTLPLPNRKVEIPSQQATQVVPGVDITAGYLFEGSDPTQRRDSDRIAPSHRQLPSEAKDQPKPVPGVTFTVPLR